MQLINVGGGIYINPDHITYIGYAYAHIKAIGIRLQNGTTLEFYADTAQYIAIEAFIETHAIDPRK